MVFWRIGGWRLGVVGGLALAVVALLSGCGSGGDGSAGAIALGETDEAVAAAWLAAVRADDEHMALAAAERLLPLATDAQADPVYLDVGKGQGLDAAFFRGGYDATDLRDWRRAAFFQSLARALPDTTFSTLFESVTARLESRGGEGNLWPEEIWDRGYGLCDRQVWVLTELAYQAGWDAQVVYLYDADFSATPHTVCELRRGDEVWTADPFSETATPHAYAEVAGNDALKLALWPERADWRSCTSGTLFVPAAASDYRVGRARFADRIRELLGDSAPRLGEEPKKRFLAFRKRDGITPNDRRFRVAFWHYPLLLHSQAPNPR